MTTSIEMVKTIADILGITGDEKRAAMVIDSEIGQILAVNTQQLKQLTDRIAKAEAERDHNQERLDACIVTRDELKAELVRLRKIESRLREASKPAGSWTHSEARKMLVEILEGEQCATGGFGNESSAESAGFHIGGVRVCNDCPLVIMGTNRCMECIRLVSP